MSSGEFPFEGQVERVELTLDQLVTLSSVFCAEVYESFSFEESRPIREVAEDLSKSPAAVGAHVSKLVESNLLIQVGTQKRRSRTEALYARRARADRVEFEDKPWEFFQQYLSRFKGTMRMYERQLEAWQRSIRDNDELKRFGTFLYHYVWLDEENRVAIGKQVRALHNDVLERSVDEAENRTDKHVRMVFATYYMPTTAESRKRTTDTDD